MKTVLVLNGPNLNMLGRREPEIYGHDTLADIELLCQNAAAACGFALDFRQSNHEGELVDWIQSCVGRDDLAGVVINAAAYTHTSVAIHDALKMLSIPVVEVHLSDPATREDFRHFSYVTPVSVAQFKGVGPKGYVLGIEYLFGL